jgi:hypothetical protein
MLEAMAMDMSGPLPFLHLRLHLGRFSSDQDLMAVSLFATFGLTAALALSFLWPIPVETWMEALAE